MYARKRTLILLLSAIIVSLISVFLIAFKKTDIVYADANRFSGGNGKEATPYQISTADDLCALEEINTQPTLNGYFNVYFIFTEDIDLNGRVVNPIGTQLYPFKGHVDGKGFSITNVSMSSTAYYAGLFGAISSDASLKNLIVSGNIFGNSNVGGLVGLNQGIVTNCVNFADVNCADDNTIINVGGICGYNENIITDCYNNGNIHGYGVNTGGIVGTNAVGTVSNCFNVGTVESEYYGAGGIAGNNEATISKCFNNATISAYSTAGGIVGSNASFGIVENTYNSGIVTVKNNIAGGICGGNEGAVYNSYNGQDITAVSQKGAICGFISTSAIVDSCFSSSNKFGGKLTFRGDDYPNSAILRDVDLANGDTLTNNNKAAALAKGRGANVWAKRSFDETFCYYPELSVFCNSVDPEISNLSQESTKVNRQTTEVSLGTISYVYNGKSNEPDVYRGEELLLRDVDYTVKFSNNINVGEKDAATAEITFINYFKGDTTKNFSVTKRPITVKWGEGKLYYTGEAQHPTVTVETGRIDEENITFEYLYDSNIEIGHYAVKVQLDGSNIINNNYSFEPETIEYDILGASLVLEWDSDTLYYNGLPQYPRAKIKDGIKQNDLVNLVFLDYLNNINAQTGYTVKVTCDNDNYSLNLIYTYEIAKRPITAEFEIKDFYYNGRIQYPIISKVDNFIGNEIIKFIYNGYENNISARNGYTVTAELADTKINANYILSETVGVYEIKRQPITVAFSEKPLVYNASSQCPTVYADSGVVEGEEVVFKVSDYSANINATIGETYSIVVELDLLCAVNKNYELEPVTHYYGITQAEITIAWDSKGLPLIYNAQVQHPSAVIVSEVFDDDITLVYGECYSIDAGENYKIAIDLVNKNYKIANALEYEIVPMPVELRWKGESNFVYNGSVQYPEVELSTPVYNSLELIYGECNIINVGQGYKIDITCNNGNYALINELTYSITPKMLNIIWDNETFIYNGLVQYPKAFAEGQIGNEQISFIYKNCENNFDVGIKYTIVVELDYENATNRNYVLNSEQIETSYRINKKKIELINIKAVDREYNGKTNIEMTGGKLEGVVPGDDVIFTTNMAVVMNATAGENKSVMYMPSLLGEHAYRYTISAPNITVNIYKAKFDSSTLKFNDLAFLYDGEVKSLQLQGEVPEFIQYEIIGNAQSQIGEYVVNVHFTYNETNVEPITGIETNWYIVASEFSVDNRVKLNILSGIIDYGAILESKNLDGEDKNLLPRNVKFIDGFNLGFYQGGNRLNFNGTVRITVSLDNEELNESDLKLYGLIDGELKELEFELIDSQLVFITDMLTDFYIAVKNQNNGLWLGVGVGGGIIILLFVGLVVIFATLKKRKQVASKIAQESVLPMENDNTLQQPINIIKNVSKPQVLEEKEFVFDGIYCRSYQSFLASLNYKDPYRQKEICSYSADRANRCAAGKSNGKRKDLYWQGKKIEKGSKEYNRLLENVEHTKNLK